MRKLVLEKKEDRYDLYDDKGQKIASTLMKGNGHKLSLKNCEAIANGYDLDEFIKKNIDESFELYLASSKIEKYIRIGFQIAVEIVQKKEFSELDMYSFSQYILDNKDEIFDKSKFIILNEWKSLQQNSWDVDIVTKPYTEVGEGFELEAKREFKLDSEGKLILKRKK